MGATNCPETPRQRMISMMYLVLTALLALNVSREIINAFILVEDALNTSVENFDEKNQSIYDRFSTAESENAEKVRPWRIKADEVRLRSKSINAYIQSLKIEIIQKADGPEAKAIKGNEVHSDSIEKADNLDVGSEVMIGAESNGAAYDLRDSINNYRQFLIDLVDPTQAGLITSFKHTLNTDDPAKNIKKETEIKTWETVRFNNLPLIAIVTMLSKLQTDIANTESDAINYLYKQIDIGDVKVNKIEAVVRAKSNYIFKDARYDAEVFLAAFDTTQQPKIYVGRVDSVEKDDGTWEYFMPGKQGVDFDTIPVDNGKGVYTAVGRALSPSVKWQGLIEIPAPGGTFNRFPFKADYQVAEAGLVVSPTKMNVFYIGVPNPVDISVPGVPKENITATMTNGTIQPDKANGGWVVRPEKVDVNGKMTKVTVVSEVDGKTREMGSVVFRVKIVPNPVAKVAMKQGGFIDKTILSAQTGVLAEIEDFDFEMPFKVISFDVSAQIKEYTYDKSSSSNRFTNEQLDLIEKLRKGNKVTFENIKAKGDDGIVRSLSPLIFKLK